jgi:hypothetical protein
VPGDLPGRSDHRSIALSPGAGSAHSREMSDRERRIQRIAVGLAGVAVIVALIAVFVVATRQCTPRLEPRFALASHRVPASDLARLLPDTVKQAGDGLRVVDDVLGKSLGLGHDDTIVAISGRRVTRMAELRAVLRDLEVFRPTSLFVEVLRDRQPVLERWELDGDLASALRAGPDLRGPPGTPASAASIGPSAQPSGPSDPLIATVRQLGRTTYEVPRSTFETWIADPTRITAGITSAQHLTSPDGFQIVTVRPGSVIAALGIQDGDVIRGINGVELTSIDKILPLLVRSPRISVDVRRQGQAVILNYLIR